MNFRAQRFLFKYGTEQHHKIFLTRQVKYLLEKLQEFCNELKDENEIAIIERYGYSGKRYTAVIAGETSPDFYCVL